MSKKLHVRLYLRNCRNQTQSSSEGMSRFSVMGHKGPIYFHSRTHKRRKKSNCWQRGVLRPPHAPCDRCKEKQTFYHEAMLIFRWLSLGAHWTTAIGPTSSPNLTDHVIRPLQRGRITETRKKNGNSEDILTKAS